MGEASVLKSIDAHGEGGSAPKARRGGGGGFTATLPWAGPSREGTCTQRHGDSATSTARANWREVRAGGSVEGREPSKGEAAGWPSQRPRMVTRTCRQYCSQSARLLVHALSLCIGDRRARLKMRANRGINRIGTEGCAQAATDERRRAGADSARGQSERMARGMCVEGRRDKL